ncbi:MAG TPA: hypothetical protein VHV49_14670 [Pseudonocardiaceae bacterium]|nr:hypothetical protein [Pseudonocardiaceae bacterium]
MRAGLLAPRGERRGRHYVAQRELVAIRRGVMANRPPQDDSDPFAGV